MAWAARRVDCPVDRHMPQLYSHLVLCAQVKINKTAWLPVQGEEEEEHRAHADTAMWQPRGRIAGSHGSNGRLHQQPAAAAAQRHMHAWHRAALHAVSLQLSFTVHTPRMTTRATRTRTPPRAGHAFLYLCRAHGSSTTRSTYGVVLSFSKLVLEKY